MSVTTDKPLYGNFETVKIDGAGYTADCALKIEVEDPNSLVHEGTATTDASGAFAYEYVLADVDGTYTIRVIDAASGEVLATKQFLDGFDVSKLHNGDNKSNFTYLPGETVHAKGSLDGLYKHWRWSIRKPDGTSTWLGACEGDSGFFGETDTATFQIPANTPVTGADGWRFQLTQYGNASRCQNNTNGATRYLRFRVAGSSSYADEARTQQKTWFNTSSRAWVSLAGLTPNYDKWTVEWIRPNGTTTCKNSHGTVGDGLPNSGNTGVLDALAYAPFTSGSAAEYNKLSAYWRWPEHESGKCATPTPSDEGQWKVKVVGEEKNPDGDGLSFFDATTTFVTLPAFKVDATAPRAFASYSKTWQNAPVAVTLSGEDTDSAVANSGIARLEYAKAPAGPFVVYSDASKPTLNHGERLYYRSVDNAGNMSAVGMTDPAKVDGDAPTTTATGLGAGWQKAAQTITLTATDAGPSGVAKVEWRKLATDGWTTYDAAAKPVLANGESLQFRATDVAGNEEAVQEIGPAQVDGQPPRTTSDFKDEWHKADVEVTLTAGDNGPAPTEIQWRKADTDAWTTYDAASKPVLEHGERLEFRGVDAAGNEEEPNATAYARIDGEAPTTADDVPATWSRTAVEVTLTVTEHGPAAPGATKWRKAGETDWQNYSAGAKPKLNDGEQLEYASVDAAGNAEDVKTSPKAKVDGTAPVTTATFSTDWSKGPVPVTLEATDGGSGVERIEYKKPGASSWTTYDAAAKPTLADGEALLFRATDVAGNEEAEQSTANAKVDTEPPTTTATLASGWQKAAVSVQLVATDAKSGVDKIEVRIAGAATWATYDDAARPALTHGQSLEFRATDKVGNTETTKVTAPAQVDGQAPATTDNVPAAEVDGPTAVTLNATDAGPSGLAKIEWRKAGGSTWTTYDAAAKPVLAGGERLEYRATDVAGNAETVKQSAALKVKAPVTGTDTNKDAQGVSATSSSRSAAPTVTNLAISPACMVGLALESPTAGRKAVKLSYVLGGGAQQVEITIQKRNPSAARKTCATTKNVRKPGAKYETVDQQKVAGKDGAASNDVGSYDETATARAASAKKAKTVRKIVARHAAVAGKNSVTLAKLASGKQLEAGTYRVVVVAIGADGQRSAPASAVFRVASGA